MLVFMIFAITGVSQLIVMDNYIELDEQQALKDATWMRGLIKSDMDSLEMVSLGYATGDDHYEYVVSPDEEYVLSHLTKDVFRINRLDLIVYLDLSGEVVHGSFYDEMNDKQKPLSGSLLEFSSFSNCSRSGFINLPEGLLLISSSPIVKSSGDGPARGTVVMGRFLDSDEMNYLSEDSGIAIELLPADDPQLPAGIWNEGPSEVFIETVDEDVLAGYYPIIDVFGDPAMVARTTTPRSITDQWLDSLYYYALSLLFVGLVFAFLLILFLDDIVLKRISKLCVDVKSIGQENDLFSRLDLEGDDELSRLSDSINSMLGKLEDMHKAENHAVMKAMPVMVVHMKLDGTIIHRNDPQNGDLLFLSSMDFNNIYDILPEDTAKLMRMKIQDIATSKEVGVVEYNLPVGDRMVNLESRILVFGEDDVLAIITDNSHRKAAESALIQSKLEAEASSRTKSEFIANMSHELRTPLNSIIGFSNIIYNESHGSLNESQKKYISTVIRNGKHLSNIINDILSVSKIEAGKMELHVDEFFVSDTINEVEAMMAPIALEKGIDMSCNIDIVMPVKADMIKFKQIVYNLVSNAINFTDKGGTVTIGGNISEDFVHISVKDRGIGISPENQDKLFNPFFQADSSISRKVGGTGLGLVIVKKFTEMHGGYVQVESKEGEGSTFTVSFPFNGDVVDIP
ncbi:ATP-binding protein [Methanococcoides methylutens]|uniref:ATP-binding protein n=1 Tax=Methanococcoides methylutens TaxID=2226 RepID=UPI004044BA06